MFFLKTLTKSLKFIKRVIEELFEPFLNRYQIGLEASMKGSDFIFDYTNLFHCKCHKTNLKCGGLYTDSPDWRKKQKTTINPISDGEKCFQHAATIALNHEKIGTNL